MTHMQQVATCMLQFPHLHVYLYSHSCCGNGAGLLLRQQIKAATPLLSCWLKVQRETGVGGAEVSEFAHKLTKSSCDVIR